jgi:hypothetical protein
MRLLREVSVNAVRSHKAWTVKEDFITLWWMSAGRFPELNQNPYSELIGEWISQHLPFDLTTVEKQSLWE